MLSRSNRLPSVTRRSLYGLLASLFLATSAACEMPPPVPEKVYVGDTVVVVGETVKLERSDQSTLPLNQGHKLYITEVRDGSIHVLTDIAGERQEGWIFRRDVKLDTPPASDAGPLVLPDKPDDAAAVESLRKLGVQFERNDHGNVHALDATASQLTDDSLRHLSGLFQLTVLDLTRRPITDEGLKALSGLKTLKELYLGETQVTDRGLAMIKDLVHVEILGLSKTRVTGAGLPHLKNLRQLLVLNLGQCAVGNDDLKLLQKLPVLEVLAVPNTQVTAAGLVHLTPLSRLRVLNVINCAVDDSGLEPLKAMGNLRIVHIRGTKISAAGIEAVGEVYPELAFFE